MRKREINEGVAEKGKAEFGFSRYHSAVKIQMLSNRELVVDGCKGVLEYSEKLIRLNLVNQQLKLTGRNLLIRALEKNYVQIDGFITSVEFI